VTASAEGALWISESGVVSMMDIGGAIQALERGLIAEAEGNAQNMIKTHVEWDGSSLHAIGAVFPGMEICGTKTWSHTKAGATPVLLLFDTKDGSLRAVIEAFALGQMRTAAASGVATRWLALDQADEFAMIGTGKQAITQVAAVLAVRPIRRIRVFSRDEAHRNQFVARVRSEFQVETVASLTVRDAILGASIVTVATRATDPIVTADMVQTGVHINSIGAIVPTRAEISHDVLARSTKVVTDSVPQAQRLSREMIEFFGNDPAAWNAVQPLATVVANRFSRERSDDVTLFKALGVGISDLSLGIEAYRQALASELGRRIAAPRRVSPRLSGKVSGKILAGT
jgi:alanine dehydrogenase